MNPVPHTISHLLEFKYLAPHRQSLFTVLKELYSNALEHGVLGLNSAMKASAEGFSQYYTEREARLAQLEEGWIRIDMELLPHNSKLLIRVHDSGTGFDYRHWKMQTEGKPGLSGRGIMLLHALCESVHFTDAGNQVEVAYVWENA